MTLRQALVAGGGIGGLAAGLACVQAGWQVRLFERAAAFGETGAGLQLGPNAMRRLAHWGLGDALAACAAQPERLRVLGAVSGRELAALPLGADAVRRHGAPYATVHRADLHALLLAALRGRDGVWLRTGCELQRFEQGRQEVTAQPGSGPPIEGDMLIGADGLWSVVRPWLLVDGAPRFTGHLAFRAVLPQAALPSGLRSHELTAWLGPRLHAVRYPVRAGQWLNVVVLVEAALVPGHTAPAGLRGWDHAADAPALRAALAGTCSALQDLAHAIDDWRVWALCDRDPLQRPEQLAQGRVALLGDAAHPMLPYLAQGAAMAIEDAAELEQVLAMQALDVPTMLRRYALNRWQRNARVQALSRRNARIFHADGLLRQGRDVALGLVGPRLLAQRWLYNG